MNVAIEQLSGPTPEAAALIAELDGVLGAVYSRSSATAIRSSRYSGRTSVSLWRGSTARRWAAAPSRCSTGYAEVKRMYTRESARGRGVGKALLARIEQEARAAGRPMLRLETGTLQTAAIGLYESAGFVPATPSALMPSWRRTASRRACSTKSRCNLDRGRPAHMQPIRPWSKAALCNDRPHISGMSDTPTFAVRPSFLGIAKSDPAAAICVAGIPYDLGTSNRPGARFGPTAIRQASRMLVDGDHPIAGTAPAERDIADIGDFRIVHGDIQGTLTAIEAQAKPLGHLVTLGGDHTITLALLRALASRTGPLALVHFDAHVDTWPDSFGQRFGHGSPFYHAIEEGLIDPRRTVQVGIRSPMDKDVHDLDARKGVTILFAETVHLRGRRPSPSASARWSARRPPI